MFTTKELDDLRRGLLIAMSALDAKKMDQPLCDRLEVLKNKVDDLWAISIDNENQP